MNYPLHVILRKKFADSLNTLLSLFSKKGTSELYVNKDEIEKILVIRPNYRIGNILFLTPLINELHKQLPNAKIDIVVGMRLAGKILEPMPNVNNVMDIPRQLLLHPIELFKYIKQARKEHYDIALNVSGGSTSAQLVSLLIKAKYKASFYDKKLWVPFTHIQQRGKKKFRHMGLESLEFLRFFNFELPNESPSLDIKLTDNERKQAKSDLNTLLQKNHIKRENHKIIALFRNARFDKKIEESWWKNLLSELKELDNSLVFIDILSPDIPTKLDATVLEYSNKDLRALGAFFQECDLFISADTGPLHLAVASGATIAALFTKTEIPVYGALGKESKNIDINNLSPKEVAKLII